MRLPIVLTLAAAEARSLRRLVRYGFFVGLALFATVSSYFYYAFLHGYFSPYSGSFGLVSPRYVMVSLGVWYLTVFLIGLVFLAFDTRIRDEMCGISEVLDSRPFTNLELVAGRFLGILLLAWVPVVALALLLQAIGWLCQSQGWRLGEPIQWPSVFGFVVFMALPALAFFLALVSLVALAVKNRLLTALLAFAFLAVVLWCSWQLPASMVAGFDLLGSFAIGSPSDLVPRVIGLPGLVQRLAVLLAAGGLLGLAAAIHPRLDGHSRSQPALVGGALLALALCFLGWASFRGGAARHLVADWEKAHGARAGQPVPDLRALRGSARIEPGASLALDLEISFRSPPQASLDRALFSLNPGLEIGGVSGPGGQQLEHTFENGLLEVKLAQPLAPAAEITLRLQAAGRPQLGFAYLGAPLHPDDLPVIHPQRLFLGTEAAFFESGYVALLPGIRWLPAAGPEVGRYDLAVRPADFFDLDLEVEVPAGWLAAGPGRRRELAGAPAGRVRYRFAPPAPVPEAALVASRFTSRSSEIAGVELEVLLHPGHGRNLDLLAPAGPAIRAFVGERLAEAAELGLSYPYDALTLVEVPRTLRSYAGGWSLESAMAPPSLLLVRENDFPAARFDITFRDPSRFDDFEGGLGGAQRSVLEGFFESDVSGSNIFQGAARNFFRYQTSAAGPEALALGYVADELTGQLVTGKQGYFSAHAFAGDISALIGVIIGNYELNRGQGLGLIDAILSAITDRPEIWDRSFAVALADLDPANDPRGSLDVLTFKGKAVAHWIFEDLGRRRTGEMLGALRSARRGESFALPDFLAAAERVDAGFGNLAADWLDKTALPGFVVSPAQLVRLTDGPGSTPRYQTTICVRNDEQVAGLLRLRYQLEEGRRWEQTDAFRLTGGAALELGVVTSRSPLRLILAPYLSLNRKSFSVPLPAVDESRLVAAEPHSGSRPCDWRPNDDGAVMVDDLDAGFSIESAKAKSGGRFGDPAVQKNLDGGLPVFQFGRPPLLWSREDLGSAWGKYRHTAAVVRSGPGDSKAVFSARLPQAGRWRVEIHMPGPFQGLARFDKDWQRGTYQLGVVDAGGDLHELSFDAAAGQNGWNALGELELAAGPIRLEFSNRTNGDAVIADAVRFLPIGSARRAQEQSDVTQTRATP